MPQSWEKYLKRWTGAGFLDEDQAARIREYETEENRTGGFKWPVWVAISLGAILIGAGALLFVAAHWDTLSPVGRFVCVLLPLVLFHVGGSLAATRFSALSCALHAIGTIWLGSAIFMTAQIFNLQEHWPRGVMLWAIGSVATWLILRDWPHVVLSAILVPTWLCSEWMSANWDSERADLILSEGLLLLSIAYLTSVMNSKKTPARIAIAWLGGVTVIPCAFMMAIFGSPEFYYLGELSGFDLAIGYGFAMLLPLIFAWLLRGRGALYNLIAVLWIVLLELSFNAWRVYYLNIFSYLLWGLGSIGLIAWGLKERRKERINLGILGFGLTVLAFYFSSVMDKIGRSVSLIGLGILFLFGGWLLEKTRRRLVARVKGGES